METGTARHVEAVLRIDDDRLERIADMFVSSNILARYGVTFSEYLGYVAAGMCHYYVFCKGVNKL